MITAGRGFVLVGKFYRRDFDHLVKKSWGDFIHVAKTKHGQNYHHLHKMGREGLGGSSGRDFVRLPIRRYRGYALPPKFLFQNS